MDLQMNLEKENNKTRVMNESTVGGPTSVVLCLPQLNRICNDPIYLLQDASHKWERFKFISNFVSISFFFVII